MKAPCGTGSRSKGFTLIELMVAVSILTISMSLAAVALPATLGTDGGTDRERRLSEARARAVTSGAPVVVAPTDSMPSDVVLFLPDGRAAGDGIDFLTGRVGVVR